MLSRGCRGGARPRALHARWWRPPRHAAAPPSRPGAARSRRRPGCGAGRRDRGPPATGRRPPPGSAATASRTAWRASSAVAGRGRWRLWSRSLLGGGGGCGGRADCDLLGGHALGPLAQLGGGGRDGGMGVAQRLCRPARLQLGLEGALAHPDRVVRLPGGLADRLGCGDCLGNLRQALAARGLAGAAPDEPGGGLGPRALGRAEAPAAGLLDPGARAGPAQPDAGQHRGNGRVGELGGLRVVPVDGRPQRGAPGSASPPPRP